jgi:hypothetical protein
LVAGLKGDDEEFLIPDHDGPWILGGDGEVVGDLPRGDIHDGDAVVGGESDVGLGVGGESDPDGFIEPGGVPYGVEVLNGIDDMEKER